MVICALGAAYYMRLAYQSEAPEQYFMQFFLLFLGLFAASGIGNGSTFRTIAVVFSERTSGSSAWLDFSSCCVTVHSISRKSLGEQINAATPEYAMIGFAIFYGFCLILNWFLLLAEKWRVL